jgi:hypothetical protein
MCATHASAFGRGLKNPSFMIWKADNDIAIDLNLVGQVSN